MSERVAVPCPNCGKVAMRYPSQVRWRGARFCSYACRSAAATTKRMGTCQHCGARYERASQHIGRPDAGKYCSRDCWRAARAADRSRRVELVCPSCGVTFSRPASWVGKGAKHCSRACAAAARVRLGSEASRGAGWRRLAESIRERDGRLCVRCSEPEREGRRHPVDHIVPWVLIKHRPEVANDPANLATLCDQCHGRKTTVIEPRILRGDWLALQEFYGRPVMLAAMARVDLVAS